MIGDYKIVMEEHGYRQNKELRYIDREIESEHNYLF